MCNYIVVINKVDSITSNLSIGTHDNEISNAITLNYKIQEVL